MKTQNNNISIVIVLLFIVVFPIVFFSIGSKRGRSDVRHEHVEYISNLCEIELNKSDSIAYEMNILSVKFDSIFKLDQKDKAELELNIEKRENMRTQCIKHLNKSSIYYNLSIKINNLK